jgi:hypothetical protein
MYKNLAVLVRMMQMAWDDYKVRKIAWADREANTDLLIMSLSQLVDSNQ